MLVLLFSTVGSATSLCTSPPLSRSSYGLSISSTTAQFRSVRELLAIPKREAKENTFEVKASSFMDFEPKDDNIPVGYDFEDEEIDLMLQKLEYEAFVQSSEFIDSLDDIENKVADFSLQATQQTSPLPKLSAVWQARLLLLASAALYGTNFTAVKILNENIPVQLATTLRFGLAAIATLPWFFQRSKEEKVVMSGNMNEPYHSYEAILGGFEVGLWNTLGYIAQAIGLETTPASTSAFVCALAVVVVPLIDVLVGKKILPREIVGALLAVVGVGLLEFDGIKEAGNGMTLSQGDLYSLVQPVAFGIGFWRMEHYMRKFPTEAMKLTASQLSVIALSSVVCFLFSTGGIGGLPNQSQLIDWLSSPHILGSIFWTGLITTALTVYMETLALKTLSAAEATMIFSTEPIFGGVCASTILGEQFGIGGFVGATMVLGACLVSNLEIGDGERGK